MLVGNSLSFKPSIYLYTFDFYVSTQHVRIGIGGFSQKVFIVGLDGEQGGVHPRQHARIANALVPAQIDAHADVLRRAVLYHLFDVLDIFAWFNHIGSMP